jgi:hypothetical protein
VASLSRIVDRIWGENPPVRAMNAVQALVSRLHRAAPQAVIDALPAGYRLVIESDDVDVARFERLVAAAELLREALGCGVDRPKSRSTSISTAPRWRSISAAGPSRYAELSIMQVGEIGDLYQRGFTLLEIALRFGVGQNTTHGAVLEAGGTIRRPVDERPCGARLRNM